MLDNYRQVPIGVTMLMQRSLIPQMMVPHIMTKFGNSILKNSGATSEAIIKTGEKFVTKVVKY